jgi:hypothetical protein
VPSVLTLPSLFWTPLCAAETPPMMPPMERIMEVKAALQYSLNIANFHQNNASGFYKSGATKLFDEKVRVAQVWVNLRVANSEASI